MNRIKSICVILLLHFAYLHTAFSVNTLVKVDNAHVALKRLDVGDKVISQLGKDGIFGLCEVTHKKAWFDTGCVQISFGGDAIILTSDQSLYAPLEGIFKQAQQFKIGDSLLSYTGEHVIVENIQFLEREECFLDITVEKGHNFYVSPREILVHNFAAVILGVAAIETIFAWIGTFAFSAIVAREMAKEKNIKGQNNNFANSDDVTEASSNNAFSKRYCWCGCGSCDITCGCASTCICGKKNKNTQIGYTYKNGKYDEARYHHQNSRGNGKGGKSPAPQDGQGALDSSVKVDGGGNRRVGVTDDGSFVVFDRTSGGMKPEQDVYHGHIRTWEEICAEPKGNIMNAIIKNGIANAKGKVIKR